MLGYGVTVLTGLGPREAVCVCYQVSQSSEVNLIPSLLLPLNNDRPLSP